jgi:hypothetical protein
MSDTSLIFPKLNDSSPLMRTSDEAVVIQLKECLSIFVAYL